MSYYTSLSGLKGAQSDLSVISNNIANVGSVGFKRSRAEFGDLISASPFQSGNVAGQGTRIKSVTQQFTQGGFQTSDRALDLAVSGQGFFVTKTGSNLAFTRNGAFQVDENRFVVDTKGDYLQVLPVDSTGIVTATGLSSATNLQIPQTAGTPKATTAVSTSGIFPNDADLPANRAVWASTGQPYAFDRFNVNSYNYSTATTVYDSAGNPQQATFYYTRQTAPTDGSPSVWEVRLYVGNQEASADGNATTTPPARLQMQFDSATGKLISPSGGVQFSQVLPSGASQPIGLKVTYGPNTQQASSTFSPGAYQQNGKPAGQLDNVSVGADGLVNATYSDGSTIKLGKIMIANFANPNGLRQMGDAKWSATGLSGLPIINEAGSGSAGSIQSGALEQANVDITEELVALISAQRNFSANAKAIETANNMTQTIVNLRS